MLRSIYLQLKYNPIVVLLFGIVISWFVERVLNQFADRPGGSLWLVGIFLTVVVTVLLYQLLLLLLRGRRIQDHAVAGTAPPPRRGLILLFGREETARMAVKPHRDTLDFIWFVVTEQSKSSLNSLPAHWWGRAVSSEEFIHNPYRPEEAANAVARAVSHAGIFDLAPNDLACDVTGGTTAMSIGAEQGCRAWPGIALQMTPAVYNRELNRPTPLDPILLDAVIPETEDEPTDESGHDEADDGDSPATQEPRRA
ncbi:MAG: hypothetical protein KDD92_04760 [Caldilineaceae bacterium]|nr:hypothetical protein [Caldilineaceae bacterium]